MMYPQMPDKTGNFAWILRKNAMVHWGFKVLVLCVMLGIFIVWGIDGVKMSSYDKDFVGLKLSISQNITKTEKDLSFTNVSSQPSLKSSQENENLTQTHQNIGLNVSSEHVNSPKKDQEKKGILPNFTSPEISVIQNVEEKSMYSSFKSSVLEWISADLEANYSANLLTNWLAPGGEPCRDSKSVDITIPALDGQENIVLSSGEIHEFVFQALDDQGKPHCLGGDYFETDLSGESWKSRPPIKDLGNGTYQFSLQVHPDFAGDYNLTIILLFRRFEGLKFSPERFAFDKVLRVIPIKFNKSSAQLPAISQCKKSDLVKDVWSGRWTRHAKNDSCEISDDGRYRCQEANFPCQGPWCNGPMGLLESNGWVYSTHCSFKMFTSEEAWNCLNGRWIFWWGDSNHCDTIRNILNFMLDIHDVQAVPRRYDANITNPKNPSQSVRFTSIFNGHPNATGNYQGLNSLINAEYREVLKGYFLENVVPDTIIMNSGLHDGVFWPNIRKFVRGADYAAEFWKDVVEGVRRRGVVPPRVIYRTTVTTGGYARRLAFNPHKMEAFNGVVLDKLRQHNVVDTVIDDFDMTYPWHYDNRCNDGVHYGRGPAKLRWRDGQIGHQYFVDLMLGHVLLNALCSR